MNSQALKEHPVEILEISFHTYMCLCVYVTKITSDECAKCIKWIKL